MKQNLLCKILGHNFDNELYFKLDCSFCLRCKFKKFNIKPNFRERLKLIWNTLLRSFKIGFKRAT